MGSAEASPPERDDLAPPALIAAGVAALAAGTFATLGRWMDIVSARSPNLAQLAQAAMSNDENVTTARYALRDEIIGLLRELSELAAFHAQKTAIAFDENTRPPGTEASVPTRLNRVKR
jgi:hypothetical protein